uniref:Uncharacterized protein n=1 Tax=Anguilla anguilla TaxID=7936 RepID=A0A0E9V7S7_ANGAN
MTHGCYSFLMLLLLFTCGLCFSFPRI